MDDYIRDIDKCTIIGLNSFIDGMRDRLGINTNSHLVLQRIITPDSTFKAYKSYKSILWYIDESGEKYQVFSNEVIFKDDTKPGKDPKYQLSGEIMKGFLSSVYEWLKTDSFGEILRGTYKGEIR